MARLGYVMDSRAATAISNIPSSRVDKGERLLLLVLLLLLLLLQEWGFPSL